MTISSPPLVFAIANEAGFLLSAIGEAPGLIRIVTDDSTDWGVRELQPNHAALYSWTEAFRWSAAAGTHEVSVRYVSADRFGPERTVPILIW